MLRELIEEGKSYRQNPELYILDIPMSVNRSMQPDFMRWEMKALLYLQREYKDNPMVSDLKKTIDDDNKCCLWATLNSLIAMLEAFEDVKFPIAKQMDSDSILSDIFDNFHACAKQLTQRHEGRNTLTITDEYDVQDLLYALLKLHFSDVRPEERTPSSAGNSNRMDFLLKEEQIAIEVKMTRNNLRDKNIGEQLIIDMAKYRNHPDVKTLYCFVYNPSGLINNPIGIEKDLVKLSSDDLNVKVFIRPQ